MVVCTCVSLSGRESVRQGGGRMQAWWADGLSQGTLGQWETGRALGSVQSLLVFSGHAKRYLMFRAESPDMNPFRPLGSCPWM